MVSFARKRVLLLCAASMTACSDSSAPASASHPRVAAEQQWTAAANVLLDARTRLAPSLKSSVPSLGERLGDVSDALAARNTASLERALGAADLILSDATGDAAEVDAVRIALGDARRLLPGGDK